MRDPFEEFSFWPATLHPYCYVGNSPITRTDPSSRCYPPIEWLRDWEPMSCSNLDQAIYIWGHPNARGWHRLAAGTYIGTWSFAHAGLLVGAGGLAAAGSPAVVAWGAAYLTAHTTTAVGVAAAGIALNAADEAALRYRMLQGDAEAYGEYMALQHLGAADGLLPLGRITACAALITNPFKNGGKAYRRLNELIELAPHIPGAHALALKRINGDSGSAFHIDRALHYAKQGQLVAIEPKVHFPFDPSNPLTRNAGEPDLVLHGNRIVETKAWDNWSSTAAAKQQGMLVGLENEVRRYLSAPNYTMRVEYKRFIPSPAQALLDRLADEFGGRLDWSVVK